jgi:hypothetical protein
MVWEVTDEFPDGHARPMTAAEQTQLQTDRAAWAAQAQQQATWDQNATTIHDELQAQMQQALDLADALKANTATAAQQRAGLEMCLRGIVRLAKVVYRSYDTAA